MYNLIKNIILLVAFLCLHVLQMHAQINSGGNRKQTKRATSSSTQDQEYTIGGMSISGIQYFDEELLLTVTGLQIGDKIKLEGDDKISKAILNLWKQNFFSAIAINVEKIIDDKVFLDIELKERPRLSKFNFKGIRQNEANDLKDKILLSRNKVITEAARVNSIETIKKFYYEKGYLNTKIKIITKPDTSLINAEILTFSIDKGIKSRINQINIAGNEHAAYLKLKGQMKDTKEMARLSIKPVKNEGIYQGSSGTLKEYTDGLGFLSLTKTLNYIDPYIRYSSIMSSSKFNQEKYNTDKERIVSYYNSLGYRDAAIEKDTVYRGTDGNLNIDLKINEGNLYHFGNITWRGNTKYSDSILNIVLGIKKGDIYNQELLDRRLGRTPGPEGSEDVTSLYMDDGYLFFSVDPQETSIVGDTINYELRMNEGTQATIGNIYITGNDKTHEHVIRRELRTLPGTKFSRTDLIRSQREIANLGFFDAEKIGIQPKPKPDGTVDIEYTVVEKSSDQLELQAGFGGGLGVTGTLGLGFNNFSMRNIFNGKAWDPLPMGDGQKLNIRGQANGKLYNSFNFSFTDPWFGGKRPTSLQISAYRTFISAQGYGASGTIENPAAKSMVTYGMSANIIKRLKWPDDAFVLTYGLNYQLYYLRDYVAIRDLPFKNGTANNIFAKVVLSRYSIDQPLYPRSGSNVSLSAAFTLPYSLISNKDYSQLESKDKYKWIEYHKYRFTAEWYHAIKGNLILKLAAKHGYLANYNPVLQTPFERFQVGGNGLNGFVLFGKDIIAQRGYEVYKENAIIFNKYTAEVRYPFSLNPSSTIYGLAFMDAANAWDSYKAFDPFKLNRDAGLGIRIFLPMFGMLGLDYGMRFDSNDRNALDPIKPFKNTNVTFMLGVEPD
jgi:outer membrane protein insertion porin family